MFLFDNLMEFLFRYRGALGVDLRPGTRIA